MIMYVPVYENNAYRVQAIPEEECRRSPHGSIIYRGTIYSYIAFTTEAAAWAFIHKDYQEAYKYRYKCKF